MEQIYNNIVKHVYDNYDIETLNDDMIIANIMTHVKDEYNIVKEYEIYMLMNIVEYVVQDIKNKYKTINRLKLQMNKLQALVLPEQRSPEWYELRKGMLTASSLACALGDDHFKSRDQLILEKVETKEESFV